jgi:hypothetical protein
VISKNYTILAKINYAKFKDLTTEYPEYLSYLKEHIATYRDKKKRFLMRIVKKIDYFKKIS